MNPEGGQLEGAHMFTATPALVAEVSKRGVAAIFALLGVAQAGGLL